MASRLLGPVRSWEARRALREARRRADVEILAARLPSPRLAWRTTELVADANRAELGRSLTDVVHAADERLLPSATPLDRNGIRASRAQLLQLAARLYDVSSPVDPRGMLLVDRLLVDGSSPLYAPGPASGLRVTVLDALAALDGVDVPAR